MISETVAMNSEEESRRGLSEWGSEALQVRLRH